MAEITLKRLQQIVKKACDDAVECVGRGNTAGVLASCALMEQRIREYEEGVVDGERQMASPEVMRLAEVVADAAVIEQPDDLVRWFKAWHRGTPSDAAAIVTSAMGLLVTRAANADARGSMFRLWRSLELPS